MGLHQIEKLLHSGKKPQQSAMVTYEMGKIFANIYTIQFKKQIVNKKWVKDLNRYF